MKLTDKVYCIKNFKPLFHNKDILPYEKGKCYEIVINKNYECDGVFLGELIIIYFWDSHYKIENSYNFTKIKSKNHYYFYDYFITNKELRKQKLDKLKNICE